METRPNNPHPDNADQEQVDNLRVINVETGETEFLDLTDPQTREKLIQSLQTQPGEID